MEPVGTQDIATLLGVSRQRVQQIVNTKGFPDPVTTVNRRTRLWDRAQVLAWVAGQGRYNISPPTPEVGLVELDQFPRSEARTTRASRAP